MSRVFFNLFKGYFLFWSSPLWTFGKKFRPLNIILWNSRLFSSQFEHIYLRSILYAHSLHQRPLSLLFGVLRSRTGRNLDPDSGNFERSETRRQSSACRSAACGFLTSLLAIWPLDLHDSNINQFLVSLDFISYADRTLKATKKISYLAHNPKF